MSKTVFQSRAIATVTGWLRFLVIFCGAISFSCAAFGAEGEHGEAHHGLTPDAPLIDLGPFAVTNSMIATWIVAIAIIIFAQYATRQIKEVPEGAQNF